MNEYNLLLPYYKYHKYYFWFFGLINNITFILLMSASETLMPNHIGVIGICAILPGFLIKLSIPYWISYDICSYKNRVYFLTSIYILGYFMISLIDNIKVKLLGIILSSAGGAICEATFLPIASMISNNAISYWSSGSGFAGPISAGYYILMTQILNISTNITILLLGWVPLIILILYNKLKFRQNMEYLDYRNVSNLDLKIWTNEYILPLLLVYFAEYFINLYLQPKIVLSNSEIDIKRHYPIFAIIYQFGVLISRSIKLIFPDINVSYIWIFPILQFINIGIFLLIITFNIISNINIIYLIIFYEGLIGGMAYFFTFNKIKNMLNEDKKELCSSLTTIGDVSGQLLATILTIVLDTYKR